LNENLNLNLDVLRGSHSSFTGNILRSSNSLQNTSIKKRNLFIRHLLVKNDLFFTEQLIDSKGINFIVGNCNKSNIILSSHYDGPGMYDNALGVILTISLAVHFSKKNKNICFALFDLEENGCLGSSFFFEENNNFSFHFDLGGCGVGNVLFAKLPNKPIKFKQNDRLIDIPFITDSIVSSQHGISSYHFFFLNSEDAKLIKSHKCPSVFFNLHTERDNLSLIKTSYLYRNYLRIKNILENWESVNKNNGDKFLRKHKVNII